MAVTALMLLIAIPLAIYAMVAVNASRDARGRQAAARAVYSAQMGARIVDASPGAPLSQPAQDDPISFWSVDRSGSVIGPPGGVRSLANYGPFQLARTHDSGYTEDVAPGSRTPAIVGYATAPKTGRIVLSVLDLDRLFEPDRLLLHLLSFLLAPMLALLLPTVWILVGLLQREQGMVRQLGLKNERLKEVDQARAAFLASVSHDLRTPLAAMHLSLSGLMDQPDVRQREEIWSSVHGAVEEIDRMSARVRNLLDLARLEAAGAPAVSDVCDLTDIVCEAMDRVRPMMGGRKVETDFPPVPLLVECDHAQMQTVVINLLENALKYSPRGTGIRLRGELLTGQAVLTVFDSGPGVNPGDEEKVFERYYRAPGAAATGTGLGLAICKTVVEWHGGRIGVRPATRGGAAFWIALPSLSPEEGEEDDVPESQTLVGVME